jgi:hypothetical protein
MLPLLNIGDVVLINKCFNFDNLLNRIFFVLYILFKKKSYYLKFRIKKNTRNLK